MSKQGQEPISVDPPRSTPMLRADQVERGPRVAPERMVTLYDPAEWELFIRDWAESLKGIYHAVERLGGAGDQGRDVVAYTAAPNSDPPWDSFQCKHYDHALTPSEIWPELGKLCHHTFRKHYTVPRSYSVVAPRGVGTKLWDLLRKPHRLREELIANWDRYCRNGITDTEEVALDSGLRAYIEAFDFGIVTYCPIRKIIDQLRSTPCYVVRFGGGLPDRPPPEPPPPQIATGEARYVRQLLNAYGDCLACALLKPEDLAESGAHRRHFDRCREDFYRAESLRVFSRNTVPEGTFESLQDQVFKGVVDVAESDHKDGFERVRETVRAARELQIQGHALISVVTQEDRSGICHQLANGDKLIWVKGR